MALLEAIQKRRTEIVERLTEEMTELGSEPMVRGWLFENDGAVELACGLTGEELEDNEAAEVFKLLDQLCREAVVAAGGEEGWVAD